MRKYSKENMCRSLSRTFTCTCGQVFTGTVHEYVNVARDSQLRYIVLAGLLNVSTCPNCGRRAAVSCPFMYSDPEYNVLAYVYPRANATEEARERILKKLRSVYMAVARGQELQINDIASTSNGGRVVEITLAQAREMPSLRVVFGLDQLNVLMNTLLKPEERLGKLALSTQSRDEAAREQFRVIARKLAMEMGCGMEVEDLPEEYTVWVYGARRQIGSLMRELAW